MRSYAQSSNQDGQHKLSTANSAIIIPRSVNAVRLTVTIIILDANSYSNPTTS